MNSDDRALGSQWTLLQDLAGALGLATEITAPNVEGDDGARIDDLIEARKAAKASKNYGEADRIRDELLSQGIELIDKPGGITEWVRA